MCICCGGVYYRVGPTRFPFCDRCFGGRCSKCAKAVRDAISGSVSKVNAGGRPPGPRMPCGWGCGAELTGQEMRPHFTRCPNRPTVFDLERRHSPLAPTHLALTQDRCDSASPQIWHQGQQRALQNEVKVKRGRPSGRRMPAAGAAAPNSRLARCVSISPNARNGRGLSPQVCAAVFKARLIPGGTRCM
jgi:hypothetical protein